MLTVQNVKDKTFEKAVFGGYDMGGVDQFMDEVVDTITGLQKENAVLKSKMKVLVDKIEEYRSTEDAMRLALLSAQKMSVQIENEAKEKRDAMLAEASKASEDLRVKAKADADRVIWEAKNAISTSKAKISSAQQASADYIARMKNMCQKHMDFLNSLEDYRLPDPETIAEPEAAKPAESAPQSQQAAADDATQLFSISQPAEPDDGRKFKFEDMRFNDGN